MSVWGEFTQDEYRDLIESYEEYVSDEDAEFNTHSRHPLRCHYKNNGISDRDIDTFLDAIPRTEINQRYIHNLYGALLDLVHGGGLVDSDKDRRMFNAVVVNRIKSIIDKLGLTDQVYYDHKTNLPLISVKRADDVLLREGHTYCMLFQKWIKREISFKNKSSVPEYFECPEYIGEGYDFGVKCGTWIQVPKRNLDTIAFKIDFENETVTICSSVNAPSQAINMPIFIGDKFNPLIKDTMIRYHKLAVEKWEALNDK